MIRKVKIILMLLIAIFSISMLTSTVVRAEEITDIDWGSQITDMDTNAGKTGYGADMNTGKVDSLMGKIISVVRVIAVGVAIVMITILAMKYLTAAPGDKADIKKHAVVYVVGAVILFGFSGILGIIIDFSETI